MKTTGQVKIWKNKINCFNDGFVTKVQIVDHGSGSVEYIERIVVAKGVGFDFY